MRNLFSCIAFFVLLLPASAAMAQHIPDAGTSIDNTALGYILYPPSTDTVFINSNKVSAIVDKVEDISLFPDHHIQIRKGQQSSFTHALTNTGNVSTTVTITATNTEGDDFNLANIIISDSSATTGKAVQTAAAGTSASPDAQLAVTLAPRQVFNFQVKGTVSNEVPAGAEGILKVQATTQSGALLLNNTDILDVLEGPVIEVNKQALEADPSQGGVLTYRILGSNKGDQTARAFNITADGKPLTKVLLLDGMPANTTFSQVKDTQGGLALYHIAGDSTYQYLTQPPADLTKVDVFAVAYDSLGPGQQFEVTFAVTVNSNAAGQIKNVAQVDFNDPVDGDDGVGHSSIAKSNLVQDVLPEYDATLHYFTDDSYADTTRASQIGIPLHLQANASGCNIDAALIDTTTISLVSAKTGDEETFKAIETGINTGYFRIIPEVPTRDADKFTVVHKNGIMETVGNDVIKATLPQCTQSLNVATAYVAVAPYGVIFNSKTGDPVAGATISLIDVTGQGNGGKPGAAATVFDAQDLQNIDNTQTTNADGEFQFPYVKPSTYRIEVTPPAGYQFASVVPVAELPAGRTVDKKGSYGKEFTVEGSPGPVAFDVPIDPVTKGALFIKKTASTSSAEIGDFVSYQITIVNNSASVAPQVKVEDTLPFGFRYEKGTARLDDKPIDDPDGGKGPSLSFSIGDIEGNGTVTLTYRVLLGSGAMDGNGTNTAVAVSDAGIHFESNQAQSTIDVRGGVFSDKGYIIGKVFADYNRNNVQDAGEPGVPGVRLYLENGSFVITDSEGKYTFYGIDPAMHILKVDNYSLPKGSKLSLLDNRNAGDASSLFVDLKNGEMHRADFAICNNDSAVAKEIKARRVAFQADAKDEIGTSMKRRFTAEGDEASAKDVKRAQASGMLDGAKIPDLNRSENGPSEKAAPVVQTKGPAVSNTTTSSKKDRALEKAMVNTKVELGFIGIKDNDTLNVAQTRVWIKSEMGPSLALKVNGKEVSEKQISKRSKLAPHNLQAYEYIGVNLNPGKNTLSIEVTDHFGNKRGTKTIHVYAPGNIQKVSIKTIKNDVPADGHSYAVVRVQLEDENGLPVKAKTRVMLDASIGTWLAKDESPSQPGLQAFISGGTEDFKLQAPAKPQDAKVRASIGATKGETEVSFLPDLRPLIAAGIIQGTIRLNDGASIQPAHSADGFEQELKTLSYSSGNATADARAAFFLKGKIKGNMLLTAGFNSEKNNDRLFRDIQPDEFYPVYGESSIKGYDAQSTGRLYVRVDHKKTYALYGDFVTQENTPAKSLGEYNRTQTGIKFHYEKNRFFLNAFGSQASSLQRIEEIRGKGLSGPYNLQFNNILINSERIEIITRDRNQPAVILKDEQLTRFRDYVIEPFTGEIIFKSPVPSEDEQLNPIYIRITYEVDNGGKSYLIGGFDGQVKLTNFLQAGGSFVEDQNPQNKYRLASVNTTMLLSKNTLLLGEVAQSTTELDGTGQAGRIELQQKGKYVNGRVYAGRTDRDFVNRSSQLGQGRTEAGARGTVKITSSTDLKGEFLYSSNDTLNTNTTGGTLNIQQQLSKAVQAEVGVRYSKQNKAPGAGSDDITEKDLRGKLTVAVPEVTGANIYGEYEQDINQSNRKLIAVGGDYRIKNRGKIYARHEFIASSQGAYNLSSGQQQHNTVFGIDADYMKNGKVYSEYRMDDALDGPTGQAAIGLQNHFQIYEGLGIDARLERTITLLGDAGNEGTSVSTSVDYTANPLWKGTARAEARFSPHGNSYLNTLGYGRKIDPNWTFLGKNIFNLQTSPGRGAENIIQQRLRFGFAYRQTHQNRFDALGRYELKYEKNGQDGGDYQRLVHIFSTNVNYHPNAKWTHSARLAAKKVGESSAQFDSKSLTMLLSARSIYDITRKLDGGVNASIMSDAGFTSKNYGLGAEIGYVVQRNLRLSVGFNFFGFEDRDLAASNYMRKGIYLGFNYKFDERLFRGLIPDEDKNADVYATCEKCTAPVQMAEILRLSEPEVKSKGLQSVILHAPKLDFTKHKTLTTLPETIHFASDKSLISSASKKMLNLVAGFLKEQHAFKLEILGHTDSRASYEYNLNLSRRRAHAVEEYLISQGIDANLVSFKGMSEGSSEAAPEHDVIDRAMNRLVELNLNIPNLNVRFIPQVNDLQIEKSLSKSVPEWDYVFNTEINAVPDCIHIEGDVLSAPTQYLLNRIAMALKYYPKEKIAFKVTGFQKLAQQKAIQTFLQQAGADMSRIEVQTISGAAGSHGRIAIEYGKNSKLQPVQQRDDWILANSTAIRPLLIKMMNLLKMRQDYLLITKDIK